VARLVPAEAHAGCAQHASYGKADYSQRIQHPPPNPDTAVEKQIEFSGGTMGKKDCDEHVAGIAIAKESKFNSESY